MSKIPMTVQGVEKLRTEVQHLQFVERPKIIKAIAEARGHGDLKENAEYHAAKERQSFLEGRIADIESKLSNAQVIDILRIPNDGKVIFGTTVKLQGAKGSLVTYRIVGDDEADFKSGLLSYNAPLARACIGKFEGDTVEVRAPGGDSEYSIESVEYI